MYRIIIIIIIIIINELQVKLKYKPSPSLQRMGLHPTIDIAVMLIRSGAYLAMVHTVKRTHFRAIWKRVHAQRKMTLI